MKRNQGGNTNIINTLSKKTYDKDGHSIMKKGQFTKILTVINIYIPNIRVLKFMKQK